MVLFECDVFTSQLIEFTVSITGNFREACNEKMIGLEGDNDRSMISARLSCRIVIIVNQ